MARLDGAAGADRMLSWGTYTPGMCLQAVSKAVGAFDLQSDRPGWYTFALRGWQNTPDDRRHYDRTPPKGAVVYFSASSNGYGHIALSLGGGRIVSTDVPRNGQIGVTTIDAICDAWGRTYLGWSDSFMGHDLSTQQVGSIGGTDAPAFPLPASQWFGPESGGDNSISGWYSHGNDLRAFQQRMKDRGWAIDVDGLYGPKGAKTPQGNTAAVTIAFQKEKGLTPDGLIGPATWAAAWTAPIT